MRSKVRVLCLVPYPSVGASNRLRVEQYAPSLLEVGIELDVVSFFDEATYRILYQPGHVLAKSQGVLRGMVRRIGHILRARRHDLVLIHREATPIGPPLVERALAALGHPYVYDFDDAIFLTPPFSANRQFAWLRKPGRAAETATRAAIVIAGNEYLASWARQHNSDVVVLPTPVDTNRHRPRSRPRSDTPVVVGWLGSRSTEPYLRMIDAPLAILARKHDVLVRVIGGQYENEHATVELLPFSLVTEPDDVSSFDIGLLPEPDDAWTRGKSAFKALVYMATGLPVVASRVGVNPQVVLDGVTGYCVDSPEEWTDALERLTRDSELRVRMGAAGRAHVEENYSVNALAPRLASTLRNALEPV